MHGHKLKTYGEIFAQSQAVTATATLGNKNAVALAGGVLGGLAVTYVASGAVTAAAGSHLTATVEHCDTADGTFTQCIAFTSAGMEGFAAGFAAKDGDMLVQFPLPETKRFVRVKVSGAGVTGTVDCILEYLAR